MNSSVMRIEFHGKRYVAIAEEDYARLLKRNGDTVLPPIPDPDENGRYPAVDSCRAIMARDIVLDRRSLGITQKELARFAGLRPETLSRIESGKHTPTDRTIKKIDAVLTRVRARMKRRTSRFQIAG